MRPISHGQPANCTATIAPVRLVIARSIRPGLMFLVCGSRRRRSARQGQPAPPSLHNKNVTPEFSELVLQTLKKDPAARPADFREFLTRFSRVRIYSDDPPPAPRPSP